ncbi:L-threonylcarbamoyladenylate synthase [Aestuariibius sp. 2305UL40-4]|uniref:L-threonylcarbamoyladenylate synthase n=1 Tax=Aestuariibius violaceus TaxID=3234132 RepID=UPI00345EA71C
MAGDPATETRRHKGATLGLGPDDAGIARAAGILREGGLVAFPTETVYGLGADARNAEAVARIYEAKGRPSFNPLIVHVASVEEAGRIGELRGASRAMAQAMWPGPLTLVLPLREEAGIAPLVTAGLSSVAVRVPRGDVAGRLLTEFGGPVAAPSANPSGRVSPTTATHVFKGLGGKIDAVVDGGTCDVGLESTIIDLYGTPRLLRAGGVPVEDVEEMLGMPLIAPLPGEEITAPGQLSSHYAPAGAIRLDATEAREGEVMLGFGAVPGDLTLSKSGDLVEAAACLFDRLHQLDAMGAERIAVAPIPEAGLGRAINDRLRRAAAPRD